VVTIRDGSRIRIRPIVIADRAGIGCGFKLLSKESRTHRFLIPPRELSESMLRYFTDIDYTNHVALGAFAIDEAGEPGVAIARYVRLKDPGCAEAAVTVLDDYQRRGIATVLLEALGLIAMKNGIVRFCGFVQWENTAVLQLAREAGTTVLPDSPGLARVDLPVAAAADRVGGSPLQTALRKLAQREPVLAADSTRRTPPRGRGHAGRGSGRKRRAPHRVMRSLPVREAVPFGGPQARPSSGLMGHHHSGPPPRHC